MTLRSTQAILAALLTAAALPTSAEAAKPQNQPATPLIGGGSVSEAQDWRLIFGGETWYIQQPESEQVFSGKLEAVAANVASSFQRSAYYRLAGRAIYSGGKHLELFDKRVGKPIVIRGKVISFPLEGGFVVEIWPGSIREEPVPNHP